MVAQNLDKLCVSLVLIEVFRICYPRYLHCPINDTSYEIIHRETWTNLHRHISDAHVTRLCPLHCSRRWEKEVAPGW
jgi:hypothetical protein